MIAGKDLLIDGTMQGSRRFNSKSDLCTHLISRIEGSGMHPLFDSDNWYRPFKGNSIEYNSRPNLEAITPSSKS
jgi:hypothetical protein